MSNQTKARPSSEKINKSTTLWLELAGLITLGGLGLIIFLSVFTNNQVKQYLINKQQIAATQSNTSDLANTLSFLEQQKQTTDLIIEALPQRQSLPTFVELIEVIAGESSTNAQMEITASTPQGTAGNKYIPFVLKMTTDQSNLEQFLLKAEKLPYIVEFSEIKLDSFDTGSTLWNITITAKVYVSDAF